MNKLSVALTLCFSLSAVAAAIATPGGGAPVYKLTDDDMAIIHQSNSIIEGLPGDRLGLDEALNKIDLSDFVDQGKYQDAVAEARALGQQIQQARQEAPLIDAISMEEVAGPVPKPYVDHTTLVFASLSLGEQGLKEVLASASGREDTVVVFRGIPEGETLAVAVTRLQKLAAQHDPAPNIIINPDLFRSYKVNVVPTIIAINEADTPVAGEPAEPKARVLGLSDPDWLDKAVARGENGDQGVKGPVEPILEQDMIEMAKERAARIDWEQQKENAIANYWRNQNFTKLDRAPKKRLRIFDPSVQITQDIQTPDGTYIARKGDIINPLDIRAFTQAVVVFDPTDKQQIELVLAALPGLKARPEIGFISFIVTQLDKGDGWESYTQITDLLDEPVTLLTPDVAGRFELEYVPSVITSGGKVFHITELAKAD